LLVVRMTQSQTRIGDVLWQLRRQRSFGVTCGKYTV
jgi:hypothetical protein